MATTTLARTFTGANGQVNKWTYSFWVKRSSLGLQVMTAPRFNGNFTGQIKFTASDQLEVNDYRNSYLLQKTTNRLFRDISAWYHIVVSNDNTVSSPDTKIYVNGVEETSFATDNEYSQNDTNSFNNDYPNYIGEKGTGDQFDGYMSHFHFIDGTAYTASTFGSTDATTGEWKINTSPSVTYGTNGFFILKNGNSVTDQSGNSNNWTVDSGTLVDTKDNPSNSYSTSNVLDNGADKAPTFSNGNLTHGVGSNVWRFVASTLGAFKGKYYCEIKVNSIGQYVMLGAGDRDDIDGHHMTTNPYPGGEPLSVGYFNNGEKYLNDSGSSYGNSYTANDIIGVAMDIDNGYVYFSKNGTFQDSGDPTSGSSGTGGIAFPSTSSATGIKQFIPSLNNANISINYGGGHFGTTAISTNSGNGYAGVEGDSKFNYQPPTGYAALSTKGLNYF